MKVALAQAKDGRLHILDEMAKALTNARAELGEFAPRIETMKIPTDKIREVIGSGGKVIREIVEKTGAKINIDDDGTVKIASSDGNSIKAAIDWIKSIASDPEIGLIYDGTVVKTTDFGAFVNFFGAKDGLVHISQLSQPARRQDHRCRQGRRQGQGEAARLRRSRQGAPVDARRRPDHRRRPRSQSQAGRRRSTGVSPIGRKKSERPSGRSFFAPGLICLRQPSPASPTPRSRLLGPVSRPRPWWRHPVSLVQTQFAGKTRS